MLDIGHCAVRMGYLALDNGCDMLDNKNWVLRHVVSNIAQVCSLHLGVNQCLVGVGSGYWILRIGEWVLDVGYETLGVGYWVLDIGYCVGIEHCVLDLVRCELGTEPLVLGIVHCALAITRWMLDIWYCVLIEHCVSGDCVPLKRPAGSPFKRTSGFL